MPHDILNIRDQFGHEEHDDILTTLFSRAPRFRSSSCVVVRCWCCPGDRPVSPDACREPSGVDCWHHSRV